MLEKPRTRWIILGLILLLALGLRFIHLDSMEFKGDEAFNLTKARSLARLESFPLTSATSSTGIPEPPIFMYLLALPTVLSSDPIFVTGAIALLNALAIIPLYLLTSRHLSSTTALIAASLYAINPWQILYSRKIWTQNLLPFFSLLFLFFLFESVFRGRRNRLIIGLAILSLTVQLHLSALFLIPFTFFILIWKRHSLKRRELWLGAGLGVLFLIPYSLYLITHPEIILQAGGELGGGPFVPRFSGILYPLQLVTTRGLDHPSLLFSSYESFSQALLDLTPLDILAGALLVAGFGYALFKKSDAGRALLVYAAASIGFILMANIQIFPHYYNALLPILLILVALPLFGLLTTGKKGLKGLAFGMLTILFVGQLYFSGTLLTFLSEQDCIWGEYGPPYRTQVIAVTEAVAEMSNEGESVSVQKLHDRISTCVNWDIRATEYIYDQLRSGN